ncbi:hypothetical protein D3C78_1750220 [compost metagenome]
MRAGRAEVIPDTSAHALQVGAQAGVVKVEAGSLLAWLCSLLFDQPLDAVELAKGGGETLLLRHGSGCTGLCRYRQVTEIEQ